MNEKMKNFVQKYTDYVGKLNYFLFCVLLFSLPFPWHFAQVLVVVWGISWLIEGRFLKKANYRKDKILIPVLLLAVLLLWECISLAWSIDVPRGKTMLSRHSLFLALPIIFYFGVNKNYNIKKLSVVFYLGCLCAILSYLVVDYWVFTTRTEPHFSTLQRDHWWFGAGPILCIKHRLYFSMAILLAVSLTPYVFSIFKERYGRVSAIFLLSIAIIILLSAIYFSGVRACLPTIPVVLSIQFLYYYKMRNKYIFALFFILLFGGSYWLLKSHSRMNLLYKDIEVIQQNGTAGKSMNEGVKEGRFTIWKIVVDNIPQYGMKGLGIGSDNAFLQARYEELDLRWYMQRELLSHNQFLNFWMTVGPFSVLLWLLFFVALLRYTYGENRLLAACFSAIFLITFLSDDCLCVMEGMFVFSIGLILIYIGYMNEKVSSEEA